MKEKFKLQGSSKCRELLKKYPDYRVFWQSGFSFKGAEELEDDKQEKMFYRPNHLAPVITTFEERMQDRYDWAAAIDITVDHDLKELHFNGFSSNDLY